jgi:hypothetical protein
MNRPDLTILLGVFLLPSAALAAPVDTWNWTYIHVEIELQENGDMLISEEQEYAFKAGHGETRHAPYRSLPTNRLDDIKDVEVYELATNSEAFPVPVPLSVRIEREDDQFRIRWSHELDPPQTHTFLLKYRVIGGLHVAKSTDVPRRGSRRERTDELYWNAVAWPRPAVVEKARVRIHLPSPLHGKIRRVTSYGAPAGLTTTPDEEIVEFNSLPRIARDTGLDVLVAFPHGILKIDRPRWQPHKSVWGRLKDRWPSRNVLIGLGVLAVFAVGIDYFRRRCPECGKSWGLRRTGDRENLNAGKFYWFLTDYRYLYRCRDCGYEDWKRMGSGGC